MLPSDRKIGFVLSAGRTGTVFLSRILDSKLGGLRCVHEPRPSRLTLMMGNLRNRTGIGTRLIHEVFRRALAKRLAHLSPGDRYVEINPMLCPITDVLVALDAPLRVVHLVRDPRTWVRSIRSFKASGLRRHVIDYVPIATPFPPSRPRGWRHLDASQKALWRWRFCNEQILKLRSSSDAYACVRYEDLLGDDAALQQSALRRILRCLELETPENVPWFDTQTRLNPAPSTLSSEVEVEEAAVQSICGPLLSEFGYESPAPVG